MKADRFEELQDDGFRRRCQISRSRREGYTRGDDVLSNFKRVGQVCELLGVDVATPTGVALFYTVTKLDRIANLLGKTEYLPKTEDRLIDSLDDAHNYLDLLSALTVDNETL